MFALTKEVLAQMGETKVMLIKEVVKEHKFYLAFFVNRLDALLWGQGGGFLATLSRKREANLVAAGEYEEGSFTIKVYSAIISRRSNLSPKHLEAIERFYEFVNLFQARVRESGKEAECKTGLDEAAANISYRRKSAILGGH
jgi:hypothetical protein